MFRCPCGRPTLDIAHAIALGPDDSSDEVSLQILRCTSCGRGAIAVYEESRRGADARWHHDAWPASDTTLAMLTALLAACPAPTSHRCPCSTHSTLADRGYAPYQTGTSFPVTRG